MLSNLSLRQLSRTQSCLLIGPQFDGNPMGFAKHQFGNENPMGDFIENRGEPSENDGIQGFRPMMQQQNENEGGNGMGQQQQQMGGFMPPPADMSESMTNNLAAMDKANIQGDSEVGKLDTFMLPCVFSCTQCHVN